jgi:hypothetical protein
MLDSLFPCSEFEQPGPFGVGGEFELTAGSGGSDGPTG